MNIFKGNDFLGKLFMNKLCFCSTLNSFVLIFKGTNVKCVYFLGGVVSCCIYIFPIQGSEAGSESKQENKSGSGSTLKKIGFVPHTNYGNSFSFSLTFYC